MEADALWLRALLASIEARLAEVEKRLTCIDRKIAGQKERLSIWGGLAASLTALAGAAYAILKGHNP